MMAAQALRREIRLSELLAEIGVEPASDCALSAMTLDSRDIRPGSLFCALDGTQGHGLDYLSKAVEQGAAAVLAESGRGWTSRAIAELATNVNVPIVEIAGLSDKLSLIASRFFDHPSRDMDIVAATGTNGKTSVCQFVAQALEAKRCGVVGTVGYGFPDELQPASHTTPGPIRLQEILAQLRANGARAAAMEVSSHALDQGRAAGIAVDTAVFTNLTRDHLDYHDDMLDYALAKRRLFHMPGLRHAVLNVDDPFGLDILESLDPSVEPVLYGHATDCQPGARRWLRADLVQPLPRGMRVKVAGSWGEGQFTSKLLGSFNASNLLAVLGVLLLRDYPMDEALARLEAIRGVPGRMECFGRADQPLVVVDYAHTPDALQQVLSVLKDHEPRRLVTVFGCGGDRDRGKRPEMGAVAERYSDRVIVTDDNPRGEDGDRIVEEILAGTERPDSVEVQRNRGRAIRQAVCQAGIGDVVLVAGKGHEATQKIGDLELPFSDRVQVTQVLNEWGGNPGREGCLQ